MGSARVSEVGFLPQRGGESISARIAPTQLFFWGKRRFPGPVFFPNERYFWAAEGRPVGISLLFLGRALRARNIFYANSLLVGTKTIVFCLSRSPPSLMA